MTGFTNGAGQIWLSDVQCNGNENRLTDCTISAFGTPNCTHAEDTGVRCPSCTRGAIRLRGGTNTTGRVEICNSNIWGTVCDDLWGSTDARVVCIQLGFETTGIVPLNKPVWLGIFIILVHVTSLGIFQCQTFQLTIQWPSSVVDESKVVW